MSTVVMAIVGSLLKAMDDSIGGKVNRTLFPKVLVSPWTKALYGDKCHQS